MEDEDLELPAKLESLLRTIVGGEQSQNNDKNLREVCRLIDLYRNFFGAGGQKSFYDQNTVSMKNSLSAISAQMAQESSKQ